MRSPASPLIAILIAVCTAGVGSCEIEPNSTIARSMENGAQIEKSWVRTWRDHARFECVASTSGACQVVVFLSECPGPACRTKVLRELTLPEGAKADVAALPPGYRYCLVHGRRPVAPGCAKG